MASAGLEKFKLNSAGVRDLLRSEGVRADLHVRAERVKAAATPQLVALDAPYPSLKVDSSIGVGRADATVTGVPLPLERSRRILGGAMDAAG